MTRFEKFVSAHSPAIDCQAVPEESIERYRGVLPDPLLEHWRAMGWCGYSDGLLWVVNPDKLRDPLQEWLGEEGKGSHAIARTGLGDIILWSDKGAFYLDVNRGSLFEMIDDVEMLFWYTLSDDEYLDKVVERKLFRKGLARLGPLNHDECYAFTPAIALGGPGTAETLQRVKLREHLSILAQLR